MGMLGPEPGASGRALKCSYTLSYPAFLSLPIYLVIYLYVDLFIFEIRFLLCVDQAGL